MTVSDHSIDHFIGLRLRCQHPRMAALNIHVYSMPTLAYRLSNCEEIIASSEGMHHYALKVKPGMLELTCGVEEVYLAKSGPSSG